jgi:2-polyprenyl-3-methyl-5-hydroxy-6-metoxy-1,4-benzoquinol methylase
MGVLIDTFDLGYEMIILTQDQITAMNAIHWWHRIPLGYDESGHRIITPGDVNHGSDKDRSWITSRFGLPEDLTGLTVLDVGAWDGGFSFEAERRGAQVVIATDIHQGWSNRTGFDFAREILQSNVEYHEQDVQQEAFVDGMTKFDVVLCYGVLYHLEQYEQAFANLVANVAPGGLLVIETANCQNAEPVWEFKPGHEGDPTNYYYPSESALRVEFEKHGFEDIETVFDLHGVRLTMRGRLPA